jgi:hypothetical protein
MNVPAQREAAIRAALEDGEPRIIRLGLVAAHVNCPPALLPLLAALANSPRVSEELRIHAVRALGKSRHRHALEALLGLVHGGTTLLGRPKLAAPSPVVIEALRALTDVWSTQKEANRFLALARRSFVTDLRRAVARA